MPRIFLYTLFSFILFSISACQSKSESQEEAGTTEENPDMITLTEEQFKSSDFQLGTLDTIPVEEYIEAFGEVHIPEKYYREVSTYLGGIVSDMNIIKGEYVKRGQRLFTLTNPQLIKWQQDFLQTKSRLTYLQEETKRQKMLAEENISAKKKYTSIKSEKEVAEASLSSLSQQLKILGIDTDQLNPSSLIASLPITAGISGYITEISITNGARLQEGQSAMKIMNTNHMHVELRVLEKDIPKLAKGQMVEFFTPNNPTEKYKAKVHLIEKMLSPDKMVTVHCHLENETNKNLFPGMYVQGEIQTRETKKLALPEGGVVVLSNATYVLMQEGQGYQFKKIKVTAGKTQGGMTVIEDAPAIPSTAKFLTKGAYYLVMEE